jgi:hypothetical protein
MGHNIEVSAPTTSREFRALFPTNDFLPHASIEAEEAVAALGILGAPFFNPSPSSF